MERFGAFTVPAAYARAYYILKYKIVSRCRVFEFSLGRPRRTPEERNLYSAGASCIQEAGRTLLRRSGARASEGLSVRETCGRVLDRP